MSFDALIEDIGQKEKTVTLTVGETSLDFKVLRLPFIVLQSKAGHAIKDNKEYLAALLVECVVDADGKHMTYEQALALPGKYAQPLIEAAIELNGLGDTEKN